MKNYGDRGGCYPPRPTALTDNTQAYDCAWPVNAEFPAV